MKKTLALLLALIMSLSLLGAVSVSATTLSGSGTETDPYKISTPADLEAFAAMSGNFADGAYYVLTNDIAYTDYKSGGDAPAKKWPLVEDFLGTFDGQGYTISGIYYSEPDKTGATNSGFGFIASTGVGEKPIVIKNLKLADSRIEATSYVGSILGAVAGDTTSDVTISGCSSSADVVAGSKNYVGGLVAYSTNRKVNITIENCIFSGTVTNGQCVGGIIGQFGASDTSKWGDKQTIVKNCLNIGTVTGNRIVGGIVGRDHPGCVVTDCVSIGDVFAVYSSTNEEYKTQFGSVSGNANSENKDNYFSASNPAKQTAFADAVSPTDPKHKAVESFSAANCPTLSADYWVFTDGGVMLKSFAPALEPEITEPPVPVDPPVSGPTGDTAIIFAIVALIAVFGMAFVAKRREN